MAESKGPVEGGLDKAKNKAAGAAVTALTGGNAAAGKVAEKVASKVSPKRTLKIIIASLVAVVVVIGGGALMLFSMFSTTNNAITAHVVNQENCNDTLGAMSGGTDASGMEEAARTVYSVFRSMGMSENNIAGMLGNFQAESEIDPTVVETIYSEPYAFGPLKQDADVKDYLVGQINPSYGSRFPLIKRLGIGLGQWTDTNDGASGNTQLRSFAKSINRPWYTLETQLAFMLSSADEKNNTLGAFISTPQSSPQEAALWWARYWEGNTTMHQPERQKYAGEWKAKFDSSWTMNDPLMNSLLILSGSSLTAGATAPDFEGMLQTTCSAGNAVSADMGPMMAFVGETINNPNITYDWGAEGPNHYDCSGWVQAAYKTIGIQIPHGTAALSTFLPQNGTELSADNMSQWQFGDLILSSSHVAMYVGNGQIAHFTTQGQPGRYDKWEDTSSWFRPVKVYRLVSDTSAPIVSGSWTAPLKSMNQTSPFGYRTNPVTGVYKLHAGTDFGASQGTPIFAAAGGKVTLAGWDGGCGYTVIINHGNSTETKYCHQPSPPPVKVGQTVKAGQRIGSVGSTGNSTGAHLHFEVHKNGTPIDPVPFMRGQKVAGF